MNKKTLVLLPVLTTFLLVGCGSPESPSSNPTTNPASTSGSSPISSSTSLVTKYTVTFAGTNMNPIQIEAGQQLTKPVDPSKDGYIFVGWYMDEQYTTPAIFPLTINSDTTIYANFYSHKEAFKKARNNTIGEDVAGYEYDYELNVTAGYMGVNLTGQTSGNAKYKSNTSDVSFYDEHSNTGTLFYDGTKYQFKKARELHKVSLDKNNVVKKYTIEDVGDDYKFDSSSFAKAIFEYGDDSKLEVTPTAKENDYLLKTSFNFSQAIAVVGNYVNHPMVEKLIGELPETSVATEMHVQLG